MAEVVPIPLRQAAKAGHFGVGRIRRDYIETRKVRAFKYGGAPDAPRLRVYLHELLAAIEADREYVPPNAKPGLPFVPRRPLRDLHPSAMRMLEN
jgi:hypothetical protein